MLTTPHPTCVQGATGDIGVVPEVGSQVASLDTMQIGSERV